MMRYRKCVRLVVGIALLIFGVVVSAADARNSDVDNPVHKLKVGRLTIFQKYTEYLRFMLAGGRLIAVSDIAGVYWPPIASDGQGRFYVGNKSIDSNSGRIIYGDSDRKAIVLGSHYTVSPDDTNESVKVQHDGRVCRIGIRNLGLDPADGSVSDLLHGVIRFVDSDGPLVGLVTLGGSQAGNTHYLAIRISPDTCHVDSANLGNPDLLVELGWTPAGHWWITGSTEGTLIRSDDGRKWTTTRLPESISELVSAYVVDQTHIWLAASDSKSFNQDSPQIVYSEDGGNTWTPLAWHRNWMSRVPPYWLEGQMRSRSEPTEEKIEAQ